MKTPLLLKTVSALALLTLPAQLHSQTSDWDAGGGADTSINLNTNWATDTLPANDGTVTARFNNGGSLATFNVDYLFKEAIFARGSAFTANSTGGNLNLVGVNFGSGWMLTQSSFTGTASTLNVPIRIVSDGSFNIFAIRNNQANAANVFDINSNIARTTASTADFSMRYNGVANSVTRFDGTITNMASLSQAANASDSWAGTLIFGGSRTMNGTAINIAATAASAFSTPASTASLVLGETTSDVQTWGDLTLNNAMKLRIGGNVTVGTVSVGGGNATAAETRILGYTASTSTLTVAGGTIGANATIGGSGANENNLALVKTSSAALTISGNNTYAGGTTLENGGGFGSFGIALGSHNALGTGPLVLGTANTPVSGGNARFRMNGFNQTVSAFSSGSIGTRLVENFGASNSVLTVNQSSNTSFSGILRDRTTADATATGSLGLTKSGAGTLELSGTSSSYTGVTTLSGGVLAVSSIGDAGLGRTISTTSGNSTVTVDSTAGLAVGMQVSASTLQAGWAIASIVSPTQITINNSAGVSGTGVSAVFGYSSSMGMATSAASNLVFDGGTLRYTGGNASTNRNFSIVAGKTARVDVSSNSTALTMSGAASSGTGAFEKLGAGTLVLAGANGFTGGTTVSSGTLLLSSSGSLTGNVTVASGATIGGNGTISGSLNLLSGGNFRFSLSETLIVNGAEVTFGGFGVANLVGFSNAVANGTYRLIDGSATINTANLANIGLSNAYDLGGGRSAYFQISSLDLVVVPEPSSVALLGLGALFLASVGWRRMRQRN